MNTPIEQLHTLQQVVEQVENSDFYNLFSNDMSTDERQLLLAAPAAVAYCLNRTDHWTNSPKEQIELLLLNPSPLDAIDEGRSWGILSLLLGLSPLTPIHLTIVGMEIELAGSRANSSELRSITVSKHQQSPIEFLLEHPEYRADAAFLMHPATQFSCAGIHALRELQQREALLFGACFSDTDGTQLEEDLLQRSAAQLAWRENNPFSLRLEQFTDSNAIWANTLWQINPEVLNSSADQRIGDLTRQTVLNIIEGGEMVTAQYLSDLQSEQSAITAILNLLALLDLQSRTELSAHLFWSIFIQIRQGDAPQQRSELLQLMANLGWIGASEMPVDMAAMEQQQSQEMDPPAEAVEESAVEEAVEGTIEEMATEPAEERVAPLETPIAPAEEETAVAVDEASEAQQTAQQRTTFSTDANAIWNS